MMSSSFLVLLSSAFSFGHPVHRRQSVSPEPTQSRQRWNRPQSLPCRSSTTCTRCSPFFRSKSFLLFSSTGPVSDQNSSEDSRNNNTRSKNSTYYHTATALSVTEVPLPTVNGGYSHTVASRAKISAANKGKTPWNKGRQRTDAERARIAAGVRKRNRERFLLQLQTMGLTEQEYEQHRKEQRRLRDAEKRQRRTEKGGYRPTEETKQKISRKLKEKYARGEVKTREVNAASVRRGFTHSEETRKKISESLRKRWANDHEYRARMKEKTSQINADESVRKRISESLRKKWQDPEFREEMIQKMSRKRRKTNVNQEHRQKISQAMKRKWQDEAYRQKAMESIGRRTERLSLKKQQEKEPTPENEETNGAGQVELVTPNKISAEMETAPVSPTKLVSTSSGGNHGQQTTVTAAKPRTAVRRPSNTAMKKAKRASKVTQPVKSPVSKKDSTEVAVAASSTPESMIDEILESVVVTENKPSTTAFKKGSPLREELYELLYGDDERDGDPEDDQDNERGVFLSSSSARPGSSKFQLGDENLDDFDPYGLDDF